MSYNLSDADRGVIVHAISEAELSCQYALAEDLRAILTRASAATVAEPAKVYPQGVMGIPPYSPPGSGSHQATPVIAWNSWQARAAQAGQQAEPKCDTCHDTGQHCVGTSGLESDGNAPVLERCPECGYGDEQQAEPVADEPLPLDENWAAGVLGLGGVLSHDAKQKVALVLLGARAAQSVQQSRIDELEFAVSHWKERAEYRRTNEQLQSGHRAGVAEDAKQIADLVLGHAEGLRVSSTLETRNGFGNDVEHCFEVSDGVTRFGVVVILTKLKAAAPTQQAEPGADERAAFEAWQMEELPSHHGSDYSAADVEFNCYEAALSAWLARAKIAAQSGQQAEPGADERAAFEAALKQYAEACHRSESSSSMDAARARVCAIFSRAAQSGHRAGVDAVEIMRICRLFLDGKEGDYDAKACFTAIFKIAAAPTHHTDQS